MNVEVSSIFETRGVLLSDAEKAQYNQLLTKLQENSLRTHGVFLSNDDKTPMSLVSLIFLLFHDITVREAKGRMMQIHETGRGELLATNRELAEQVKLFVTTHVKSKGYSLEVKVDGI